MRVFLDANILVSILNKEYPLFTFSARVLSLADHPQYTFYTSPVCLAIAFYFSEKKSGAALAKEKIHVLTQKISIMDIGKEVILEALEDKRGHDFEDGMQYYAALAEQCEVIVTEDVQNYYFSELPVVTAQGFLERISRQ